MSEIISGSQEAPIRLETEPDRPQAPGPNDPPWGPGLAIGFWFLSVLLIVTVPALFLAPYALRYGEAGADAESVIRSLSTDPTAIIIQIIAVIPAHLLTLLIAWPLVTGGRRFSFFKMLGWQGGGMAWWHYILILVGFFVFMAAVGSIFPEQENELTRILKSSRYAVFLVAFMATFTAPLVEEVVYRGVLYSALQRAVGMNAAIGLVTLLFALVHLPQYYPSFSTMFLLTMLSLILTLVRARTGNLLPCVIIHTIFNAFQSVLLIIEPYFGISGQSAESISTVLIR
ncbi:MAG: lysostaphin resistance A-like protein [Pyrinomonadaceae bacterium]